MTWAWLLAEVWVAACPARAPCLGVTRPASPECASPLFRGLVCGGRCVAYSWTTCGRCRCRWCRLRVCSRVWAGLLAVVWVVVLVVVGVDGEGHLRVRACSRLRACLLAVVWVAWLLVGGRLVRVHGCWWGCWSSSGSSRSSGLPAGGRLVWCWGGLVEC